MAPTRTILIAGAGIGGLTAALALARGGLRIVVAEQAAALSEVGAGIQLSPNATRVLQALGVTGRLAETAVIPDGISVRSARGGGEIAFIPIGPEMERRYGAPYWILHRSDLQAALAAAVAEHPEIELQLGAKLDDVTVDAQGVTARLLGPEGVTHARADALVGADGVWSATRAQLGGKGRPHFRSRTAWRATLPADALPSGLRAPLVRLWLDHDAHVVFYPLRGGRLVNLVAIVREDDFEHGWSLRGEAEVLLQHFMRHELARDLRELLRLPQNWSKWALFASDEVFHGSGPVALIGDAAHPMLPFLAQGAGMAIEDAAVLARCLTASGLDLPAGPDLEAAFRHYASLRAARVRRVQQAARDTGRIYHLPGPAAVARNLGMRLLGGERLRNRYDWIYGWRPD